jgi:hypothetical protein
MEHLSHAELAALQEQAVADQADAKAYLDEINSHIRERYLLSLRAAQTEDIAKKGKQVNTVRRDLPGDIAIAFETTRSVKVDQEKLAELIAQRPDVCDWINSEYKITAKSLDEMPPDLKAAVAECTTVRFSTPKITLKSPVIKTQ